MFGFIEVNKLIKRISNWNVMLSCIKCYFWWRAMRSREVPDMSIKRSVIPVALPQNGVINAGKCCCPNNSAIIFYNIEVRRNKRLRESGIAASMQSLIKYVVKQISMATLSESLCLYLLCNYRLPFPRLLFLCHFFN